MPDIEGEVEALSIKTKGWAVKIGPDWFNSFHNTHPNRGDIIKGFFETKEIGTNIFRNLKSFEILKFADKSEAPVESAPIKQVPVQKNTTQQDQIIRQACLKSAAAVVAAIVDNAKDIKLNDAQLLTIQTAEAFKRYVENGPQDL